MRESSEEFALKERIVVHQYGDKYYPVKYAVDTSELTDGKQIEIYNCR